jgi:hypothetical protein
MMTGERVLSTLGAIALQLAGLGLFLFWSMGAVLLITGNGGQINDLGWGGGMRALYFSYPFILAICSVVGWLLYLRQKDLFALATLSVPAGVATMVYLSMIYY